MFTVSEVKSISPSISIIYLSLDYYSTDELGLTVPAGFLRILDRREYGSGKCYGVLEKTK